MVVKFTINLIYLAFQELNVNLVLEKQDNFVKYWTKNKTIFKLKACSSVDRASDSDSESQGFDSLHA